MAAIDASIYEEILIESTDQNKTVDIRVGTVSVDYYEDIFSPAITCKIQVYNTGNTIEGEDGHLQGIYQGLPLRGVERVAMKIKGNYEGNPGLDFSTNTDDYWYVSSITNVLSETQKETFTLNLISREAITNETSRVGKKYPTSNPISSSVSDIIENYVVTNKQVDVDPTQNKYGFIGNMRKPFTVIGWLAAKSVPDTAEDDGTAGYLFYQTKDSFKFKSIDSLIEQEKKATYTYSQVNKSSAERDANFDILSFQTDKNENVMEKLKLGAYASNRMFFDPLLFTFPSKTFKLADYQGKSKNLGRQIELPRLSEGSDQTLGDLPSRIVTQVLDRGTYEQDVSEEENADPMKYQAQALMRYNSLFTQTLSMTVPSNTNLCAGDVIECLFPKATTEDSNEYDPDQSGLYMIKELCHHFDPDGSYTSMKLIRDTSGRYGRN